MFARLGVMRALQRYKPKAASLRNVRKVYRITRKMTKLACVFAPCIAFEKLKLVPKRFD